MNNRGIWIISFGISIVLLSGLYFIFTDGFLKSNSYGDLSEPELMDIALDWNYRDLERNLDNNNGRIIYVYGIITNTQPDMGIITLCDPSEADRDAITKYLKGGAEPIYGSSCDSFFIDISYNPICTKQILPVGEKYVYNYIPFACSNYLVDDRIAGWAEIIGLAKAQNTELFGMPIEGKYVPMIRAIQFNCATC